MKPLSRRQRHPVSTGGRMAHAHFQPANIAVEHVGAEIHGVGELAVAHQSIVREKGDADLIAAGLGVEEPKSEVRDAVDGFAIKAQVPRIEETSGDF